MKVPILILGVSLLFLTSCTASLHVKYEVEADGRLDTDELTVI